MRLQALAGRLQDTTGCTGAEEESCSEEYHFFLRSLGLRLGAAHSEPLRQLGVGVGAAGLVPRATLSALHTQRCQIRVANPDRC